MSEVLPGSIRQDWDKLGLLVTLAAYKHFHLAPACIATLNVKNFRVFDMTSLGWTNSFDPATEYRLYTATILAHPGRYQRTENEV